MIRTGCRPTKLTPKASHFLLRHKLRRFPAQLIAGVRRQSTVLARPLAVAFLRLLIAMLAFIAISEIGNRLIVHFSLHFHINLGQQIIDLGYIAILFVGTVVGALIAERYFLGAVLIWYLLATAFAIHILQRVAENIPNAPTYLDVLQDTYLGVLLGVVTIVLAILTSSNVKRCATS